MKRIRVFLTSKANPDDDDNALASNFFDDINEALSIHLQRYRFNFKAIEFHKHISACKNAQCKAQC